MSRRPPREGDPRTARPKPPRPTATEMVGVTFTSAEARRLLDALASGTLGAPEEPDNVVLRRKLEVALQVALAAEKRKAALGGA